MKVKGAERGGGTLRARIAECSKFEVRVYSHLETCEIGMFVRKL